jgi:hypothetical protein
MFLGIIYVARYLNPTTGQEAEIRIRQVPAGYRVTAAISPLRDGDEVITWEETVATEAAARRVVLRWRTVLSLDHGMQQTREHAAFQADGHQVEQKPHGDSATRPAQEPWGKTLRWGTDEERY